MYNKVYFKQLLSSIQRETDCTVLKYGTDNVDLLSTFHSPQIIPDQILSTNCARIDIYITQIVTNTLIKVFTCGTFFLP